MGFTFERFCIFFLQTQIYWGMSFWINVNVDGWKRGSNAKGRRIFPTFEAFRVQKSSAVSFSSRRRLFTKLLELMLFTPVWKKLNQVYNWNFLQAALNFQFADMILEYRKHVQSEMIFIFENINAEREGNCNGLIELDV